MPVAKKAKTSVKLDDVKPTEEEIKKAKELLSKATEEETKSKMASMVYFTKTNAGNEAVASSRSDARREYFLKFLVWQSRQQNRETTTTVVKQMDTENSNHEDWEWMSKEKMDSTLGPKKAESWRVSNKLSTRPDPVTGSTDEDFIEYAIHKSWGRKSDSDKQSLQLASEGAADENDLDSLTSASIGPAPDADDTNKPQRRNRRAQGKAHQECWLIGTQFSFA